jgi:hypothetical protein
MTSPLDQPPDSFPKHLLVRIGSAIGGIALGLICFNLIFPLSKTSVASRDIPYGTLAFWVVWILVFALLEHYWVPKPAVPPVSPEIKRQHRFYIAALLVIGFADLGIMMLIMQKWNSGSDDGILLFMALGLIIALILIFVLIRYFIFIMDIKERNRKVMAADGSGLSQQEIGRGERNQ